MFAFSSTEMQSILIDLSQTATYNDSHQLVSFPASHLLNLLHFNRSCIVLSLTWHLWIRWKIARFIIVSQFFSSFLTIRRYDMSYPWPILGDNQADITMFNWAKIPNECLVHTCNTRIPMHESCGPAVADRCRTGVGPMLQASGRFRPGCDVLRHVHWDMEANDGTLWTALVTWYFWRPFMLVVVSALATN